MIIITRVKRSQTSPNLQLRTHEDSHGPTPRIVGSDSLTESGGIVLLATKGPRRPTQSSYCSYAAVARFFRLVDLIQGPNEWGRVTAAKLLSHFFLLLQQGQRRSTTDPQTFATNRHKSQLRMLVLANARSLLVAMCLILILNCTDKLF